MNVARVQFPSIIRSHNQMNLLIADRLLTISTEATPSNEANLRYEVKNLYKNLLYLSREWPTDLRPKIKQAFMRNKDVCDPNEIRNLIGRGEYVCREITATYHLRKYRAMKRRYYDEHREKQMEEMFKNFSC